MAVVKKKPAEPALVSKAEFVRLKEKLERVQMTLSHECGINRQMRQDLELASVTVEALQREAVRLRRQALDSEIPF